MGKFKTGDMVYFWRGAKRGEPSGAGKIGRGPMELAGINCPVYWIEGNVGCMAETHLELFPPSMEWKPWVDCKDNPERINDIIEPPCKHCRHFRPKIETWSSGKYKNEFDGVSICQTDSEFGMETDFSCYKP